MKPYYSHMGITIYHGDCREVLPLLNSVAAIVSDPPYGMSWDGKVTRGRNGTGSKGPTRNYGISIIGDKEPFDPTFLLEYPEVLLWGFNHYPEKLQCGTALVWLKRYDTGFGSFLSDAEIAWLNRGHGVYVKRDVSLQGESDVRLHPTQKPVGIMKWCLSFITGEISCDPFMGSGTTLEAAKNLGRKAIGIEIEEKYCEIAAKRLSQEVLEFP
jgi:DNA modification methylase